VDGIPVTSIPRTLLDLAEVSDAKGLRRAYEEAARLDVLDVRALERVLARAHGRRRLTPLRDLLGYDPAPATHTRSELERLVVELDGYEYHRGRAAFERDHAKHGRLRLAGYEVLELTHLQLTREQEWVIGAVRSLLERAASTANL
jgi:Protein of unknown function (DUF559)